MKLVSAIIRPYVLDQVRDALMKIGIQGLTVYEVKGFGRQRGHGSTFRGDEQAVKYIPKFKIELFVSDQAAPQVVRIIQATAQTGQTGDGKIYVIDMEQIIRIRTGQDDDGSI